MYVQIPFGLLNVGATFQRGMDVAFKEYIDEFMVLYQDDLTRYSKRVEDNCKHLEKMSIYRTIKWANV